MSQSYYIVTVPQNWILDEKDNIDGAIMVQVFLGRILAETNYKKAMEPHFNI